jgi:hypothetical protein
MSTTEQVGGHAQQVADTARQQTKELAHSATDHAMTLVGRAGDQLRNQGDEQGRKAAGTLRAVAEDLRSMSGHSTGATPVVADVMCGLADAGDRFAGRLENEGVAGLARELADFGRRNPGRFLIMSAAAGMLAGRLLRNADTRAIKESVTGQQGRGQGDEASGLASIGIETDGGTLPPIDLPGDVPITTGAPATGGSIGGTADDPGLGMAGVTDGPAAGRIPNSGIG